MPYDTGKQEEKKITQEKLKKFGHPSRHMLRSNYENFAQNTTNGKDFSVDMCLIFSGT